MALVSMKMSAEEAKESNGLAASSDREYPYGLEISLNDDSLAKLGFTSPPAVGSVLTVTAQVKVTSTSQYQDEGRESESNCRMQITDMALSSAPSSGSAATLLYGG